MIGRLKFKYNIRVYLIYTYIGSGLAQRTRFLRGDLGYEKKLLPIPEASFLASVPITVR